MPTSSPHTYLHSKRNLPRLSINDSPNLMMIFIPQLPRRNLQVAVESERPQTRPVRVHVRSPQLSVINVHRGSGNWIRLSSLHRDPPSNEDVAFVQGELRGAEEGSYTVMRWIVRKPESKLTSRTTSLTHKNLNLGNQFLR
jgi:hypothetical protein